MPVPTTKDFSVKFGRQPDMGLEGQKAFPYIYNFINKNDDTWLPVAAGVNQSISCIGPLVRRNSTYTLNVLLDPDYNFKLLSIKYTVYINSNPAQYTWYTIPQGPPFGGSTTDGIGAVDVDKVATPYSHYISMSLFFQGSGSQTLYGGMNTQPMVSGNAARIPLPIELLQGYDYGYAQLRTPYLLPRQGILVFEMTNTHQNVDLTVGGAIYGMKVRL